MRVLTETFRRSNFRIETAGQEPRSRRQGGIDQLIQAYAHTSILWRRPTAACRAGRQAIFLASKINDIDELNLE